MAFQRHDEADEAMSEINVTPLVDVMLVLLIIFMITVPIMKQAVQVELPRASSQPLDPKPLALRLVIDAQGQYRLDQVPLSIDDLASRLTQRIASDPQLALHIWADRQVSYDAVAQALSAAQRAGVQKIGFVTDLAKGTP